MSKIDTWVDNKVVQNIAVWLFLFVILLGSIQSEDKVKTALYAITFLLVPIYLNNIFILPVFNKKTFIGILLFVFNTLIFTLIVVFFVSNSLNKFEWSMIPNLFGIMVLALLFGSAIRIARDSFVKRQQVKEAELKLLKAQLNPHFLFNTLNNLYGLSVIKSDKLPDLMLKLSDLLRYSLYDTKEQLVPLQKEIQYLTNYVSLERIRLEDKAKINLEITDDITTISIAPMLLIVFVENAFKHLGVAENKVNSVDIRVKVIDGTLHFSCINSVEKNHDLHEELETGKSGIGLVNVKKRLDLIYPQKYELEINKYEDRFSVQLNLICQ